MKIKASKICAAQGHSWAQHTDKKDICLHCRRKKWKRYTPNPHARIDKKD